jgi:hypothetical protein
MLGLPDSVTREAYSHEVSSCGFWRSEHDALAVLARWTEPIRMDRDSDRAFVGRGLFALSGCGKLFVRSRRAEMVRTLRAAAVPAPEANAVFVSAVEFVFGSLLAIGFLTPLSCVMLSGVMLGGAGDNSAACGESFVPLEVAGLGTLSARSCCTSSSSYGCSSPGLDGSALTACSDRAILYSTAPSTTVKAGLGTTLKGGSAGWMRATPARY